MVLPIKISLTPIENSGSNDSGILRAAKDEVKLTCESEPEN